MKKYPNLFLRLPILLMFILLFTSCAEFHVQVPVNNDPSLKQSTPVTTWDGKTTTWSFLWGNLNDGGLQVTDCTEGGMQDVTITRDFWQTLCSIVTLGIATPMSVEWTCHAAPIRGGGLGSPAGKSGQ